MSEELTKLAKLANKAAGDYKPNAAAHNMPPQNFGKYGVQVMGPVKDEKTIRVKSEMIPTNFNNKLESIKEESLNSLHSASFNNMNSTPAAPPPAAPTTNIDIKKEETKVEDMKKEENGGVFHEKLQGSNTDQLGEGWRMGMVEG